MGEIDIIKEEERKRMQDKIHSMSMDEANLLLKNSREIYKQIEYGLKNKKSEIKKMEQDKVIRNYLTMVSQKSDLEEDAGKLKEKIELLEQKLCDHKLVYLISLPKKSVEYCPNFKCLCCGKNIVGELNDNQVCINENYLVENEYYYTGDIEEYISMRMRYKDLVEYGDDNKSIMKDLRKRYYNDKKTNHCIKLKRH